MTIQTNKLTCIKCGKRGYINKVAWNKLRVAILLFIIFFPAWFILVILWQISKKYKCSACDHKTDTWITEKYNNELLSKNKTNG